MALVSKKYERSNFLNVFMNNGTPELDLSSGDFWSLFKTTTKPRMYQIDNYEANRPDIISNRCYVQVDLWWILMKYNDIIDPFSELVGGTVLKVPDFKDIQSYQKTRKKQKATQEKNKKDL